MAFLRHSSRHIHAALIQRVTDGLTALDWLTVDEVPFGGDPLTILDTPPFVGERLASSIQSGTVVISLGDEAPTMLEEIGGPLSTQELPFFVDVFMDSTAEATALTNDIRDIVMGRTGYPRFLPLLDMSTGLPVPGWTLELDDVERVAPNHNFPLQWQSVHLTVLATFNEVTW